MKTIFENFSAYNAGCIEEAVMPLEDQGLVLIRGENHDEGDSNGSGKTTLFEILAHTLTGKTSKGSRKNDLLNLNTPKDYHTQAAFRRSGGSHYLVDQYRKHHEHGTGVQIRIDGSEKDNAPDGYEAAQRKVLEYMGLTWGSFQGQLYLSQKYTHTMIEGKPSEKQAYLSSYFGLDSIESMIVDCKKRIQSIPLPDESQLKDMLLHTQEELDALGAIDEVRKDLDSKKEEQSKLQERILDVSLRLDLQKKASEVFEERKAWLGVLSNWKITLESADIKATLSRYRKKSAVAKAHISSLRTREELVAKLEDLGDVTSSRSYDDISLEIESIDTDIRGIDRSLPQADKRSDIEAKLASLDRCSENPAELESQLSDQTARRSKLSRKVTVLESEIKSLESIEEKCPTCSRPMGHDERDSMLSTKKKRLTTIVTKVEGINYFIDETSDVLDLINYRTKLEEEIKDLPSVSPDKLREELVEKTSARKKLNKLASLMVKVSSVRERLAALDVPDDDHDTLSRRKGNIDSRIRKLEDAYEFSLSHGDTEFDPDEMSRLSTALTTYDSSLKEVGSAIFDCQERITKWITYTEQKDKLEKSLSSFSRDKNRHQALSYVNFTLKELKKLGLRESTELLTQVLPVYLSQLFPEGEIGIRVTDKAEGFDLLFEKGGQSIPLSMISGGQAKRVGIAIIFAFAKMGRNTTNLLIADEPFTHLDQRGRAACYELLRDLNMGTILITAHDQDLQSTRKYDQIWTVKMKNHKSRLYLDG